MKSLSLTFLFAVIILTISSCSKCYKCHNLCKACSETHLSANGDTVLTIIVRSDILGEKYYLEYIDSLTSPSLGWTCRDTTSSYQEEFCEGKSQSAVHLINKKEAGLVCAGE